MVMSLPSISGAGFGELVKGVTQGLDSLFTSDEERLKAANETARIDNERAEIDQKVQLAQIGVNLQEAKSKNWFVAGWRPATGWACMALMVFTVSAAIYGELTGTDMMGIVAIYSSIVVPVQLLMLGGRTYEKMKLKEKNNDRREK